MFAPRLLDFQKTKYARFMNHRVPAHKRYQPTEYEHAANCATHALWIIPSILGSSNLYFLSDDDWETISAWIYGLGLCGLFVVSTVFHTISWKKRHLRMVERCLHMFDRMVIYFFIAASYAPWLNLRELGPWASHMRWLVWIMASVGTVYVFFFHERYKLVELLCYVIMGFFPALVILSMLPNQAQKGRPGSLTAHSLSPYGAREAYPQDPASLHQASLEMGHRERMQPAVLLWPLSSQARVYPHNLRLWGIGSPGSFAQPVRGRALQGED
ncbi:monocyte to macrophage differentiation factor 2 isoform X3 [Prionailurus bengalensis]|uniref:monocyte to macrophage differentiation factor 2 isoform X3 n=1 Tax=Prionailurus bengalensis TaxID=37029 RepID=UPI001CA955E7|nr:monocyte to macrophage differentiation factor 2 isoform X3 [Prionailurus bengalensis]